MKIYKPSQLLLSGALLSKQGENHILQVKSTKNI